MKRKENLNVITAWTLITIVKNSLEKNVKKNMKEMSKTIFIIEKVINISCFLVSAFFKTVKEYYFDRKKFIDDTQNQI